MVKMSMGNSALQGITSGICLAGASFSQAEVCFDAFCVPVQGLRLLSRRAHDCQGRC